MTPQRQIFSLPAYTTVTGRALKDVRIGFETYGRLNAARDNAVLVCHFFSGTAHAAGRYEASDPYPGWWDSVIGPGKAIDSERYFVVASDTLCCVKAFDGQTVTTGPASIDLDTGQPYGLTFPLVSMTDFVRVQKALLDHLGIEQLVAVAGPSAGSAQAIEWAVEYPAMVPRVLAVIPPGLSLHPYPRSVMECWSSPIQVDAAWQDGAYPLDRQPLLGLIEAYRLTNISALSHAWVEASFGSGWADPTRDPHTALEHEFNSHAGIGAMAEQSAKVSDANHFLYMTRACTSYNTLPRIAQSKAKFLFLPAESDLIFPPFMSETAVTQIRQAGGRAELMLIRGNGGHYDGLTQLDQHREAIQRFLASD